MNEYLVELYVPCTEPEGAGRLAASANRTARELTAAGTRVRLVRSIFVPGDETCLFLFEAASIDDVHKAARRAALPFDRVIETAPRSHLILEES